MPVKDGIQATKEIRQFEHENSLPRVRIVAVTVSLPNLIFPLAPVLSVDTDLFSVLLFG